MCEKSVCYGALFFLCLALFLCGCNQACSVGNSGRERVCSVKILNWNLQTFFDGVFDGNEYTEFAKSGGLWCKEKYEDRLDRLCQVIKAVDADVVVMEELEKAGQLYDISNRLNSTFAISRTYGYGYFGKDDESSIGCGIISRLPLGRVVVHSLDVRSERESQPSLRPVIEAEFFAKEKSFVVFVNHWKSKSSGTDEGQVWRNYQERQLAERMQVLTLDNTPCIACGDFNKTIEEFDRVRTSLSGNNILLKGNSLVPVYSPWIDVKGGLIFPGSYYYNSSWERIDHFFANNFIEITEFTVETDGPWKTEAGLPARYNISSGTGYSDHFPVSCRVSF